MQCSVFNILLAESQLSSSTTEWGSLPVIHFGQTHNAVANMVAMTALPYKS